MGGKLPSETEFEKNTHSEDVTAIETTKKADSEILFQSGIIWKISDLFCLEEPNTNATTFVNQATQISCLVKASDESINTKVPFVGYAKGN